MGSHHARVVSQSPDAEIALLVDPHELIGKEIATRYGATWQPELGSLAGIDAVIIAAATHAHYDLALHVISEATPLLVEKPVADSLHKTEAVLAAAINADVPMMCGLLERFNPAILTAMSIIDRPFHIIGTRHSPYAQRIRTGVAWDLLVHDVDLACLLMGSEPRGVEARLGFFLPDSDRGAEDVAEVLLTFADGQISQVSASRVGQRKVRQFTLYESGRMIELDLLRRGVTIYRHVSEDSADGEGRGYRQETIIEIPELVSSEEPLTAQFKHFLRLIDGTADAAQERSSILPSHRIIEKVTEGRYRE